MKSKSFLFLSMALVSAASAQEFIPVVSEAHGINESGVIASHSWLPGLNSDNGEPWGSIWTPAAGTVQQLDPTFGRNSRLNEINDSGHAAGYYFGVDGSYSRYQAYVWTGGYDAAPVNLHALSGVNSTSANSINNASWVVGQAGEDITTSHAAVWRTSDNGLTYTFEQLGPLNSAAVAINDSNTIVGTSGNYAAIWHYDSASSTYTSTTSLVSGSSTSAIDINASGSVVGVVSYGGGSTIATLWKKTGAGTAASDYTRIDLNAKVPGSNYSNAQAINDSGTVVGSSWSSVMGVIPARASIWDADGNWTDLNEFVGATALADAGFARLQRANDINEKGDIVGIGYGIDGFEYGFLITADGRLFKEGIGMPIFVPEPTSSVLLGLAGMGLLIRRKRN